MDTIVLNPDDNVAVVLRDVVPHESLLIDDDDVTALDRIPCGHKIARRDIQRDDLILKYGMPVGRASLHISKGEHVHVHNVVSTYMDNLSDHYE